MMNAHHYFFFTTGFLAGHGHALAGERQRFFDAPARSKGVTWRIGSPNRPPPVLPVLRTYGDLPVNAPERIAVTAFRKIHAAMRRPPEQRWLRFSAQQSPRTVARVCNRTL